jgi:hypothetical protein
MPFFSALGRAAAESFPGINTRVNLRGRQRAADRLAFDKRNQKGIDDKQRSINADFGYEIGTAFKNGDVPGMEAAFEKYSDPDSGASREVISAMQMKWPKMLEEAEKLSATKTPLLGTDYQKAEPELSDVGMAEIESRYESLNPDNRTFDNLLQLNEQGRRDDRQRTIAANKRQVAKDIAQVSKAESDATKAKSAVEEVEPKFGALLTDHRSNIKALSSGDMSPTMATENLIAAAKFAGVTMEPEELADLTMGYSRFVLKPLENLDATQRKLLTGTETVQRLSEAVLDRLNDPVIAPRLIKAFDRVKGAKAKVRMWLYSKDAVDIPQEIVELRQILGFTSDKIARMRSGAALTEYEVSFYRDMVGDLYTSPKAINTQLTSLIRLLETEKQQIQETPFRTLYPGGIPQEVRDLLPTFISKHQSTTLQPGGQGSRPQVGEIKILPDGTKLEFQGENATPKWKVIS